VSGAPLRKLYASGDVSWHLARERGRKTLCGNTIWNGMRPFSEQRGIAPCATCVVRAGKLLTPKQASPLEIEAERLIAEAGLPAPVKQYRFADAIGRGWRFDFAWPDRRVALEIDGDLWNGRHTSGDGRQADMVRDAWAAVDGWRVFRVDRDLLRLGFALRWVAMVLLAPNSFGPVSWGKQPADFPSEKAIAPQRYERKRLKAQARRAEARA
jgi:hypothetical protein